MTMFDEVSIDFKNRARLQETHVPRLLLTCATLTVAITYLMLFKNAFHGLDISDEGMYLLSVHNVSNETAFHNPFGDYTGLLFKLSGEKVWLFRISGFLVLGSSGLYLGRAIARFLPSNSSRSIYWSLELTGLLIVPFYYAIGILTPSYNWLNLLCLCFGLGAILNIQNSQRPHRFVITTDLLLLSLAIWVGTFAKLSTGIGIFIIFLFASIFRRRSMARLLREIGGLFGFVLSFVFLHHLFISPLGTTLEKISRGQEALEVLDPQYSIELAIDSFKRGSIEWSREVIGLGFLWPAITAGALLAIVYFREWISQRNSYLVYVLSLFAIGFGISSEINGDWTGVSARYNHQMWAVTHLLSLSILSVLLFACLDKRRPFSPILMTSSLLGIPVLYAFGSNNGFIMQITGATGIFGLVTIFLLSTTERLRGTLTATTCLVLSFGALSTTLSSSRTPYRQVPLAQQNVLIEITSGGGRLYVDQNFANEINTLRSQLKSNRWKSKTPLLDFTQYSAGVVYALDAQQPITAIPTVGGMGGVNALAEWSLSYIAKHDKEKIWHSAWLLLPSLQNSKECQLCPDISVLKFLNRSFPVDYEIAATPKNFRIYKPRD
jgi:hypothetical protein